MPQQAIPVETAGDKAWEDDGVTGIKTDKNVDIDGAVKAVTNSPHTVTADFIIKLLDAGANVSIKDKDDNEIFKLTADGMLQINAGAILRMNGSTLEVRDPTNVTFASLYAKFLYALNDLQIGGNVKHGGHVDMPEISTPANPTADRARIYSKDDSGTTKLYFLDSAGVESEFAFV